MGRAAVYRIVVQGELRESFSELVGGLHVTTSGDENEGRSTTLEGRIRDQAQLIGLLTNLYDMHVPIRSVALLALI